jgi:hypothetical protein
MRGVSEHLSGKPLVQRFEGELLDGQSNAYRKIN